MRPENLHITLHFIGQVTGPVKECLHTAALSVKAEKFSIKLDRPGYFRKARILWLGCSAIPEELIRLHRNLGEAIEHCGYQPERRHYSPHITMMRKCTNPDIPQVDFSISWQVDRFVLVESVTHQEGVEYRVIEEYALT